MVSKASARRLLQDVRTLFDTGTTGGLTDGELLGRFADRPAGRGGRTGVRRPGGAARADGPPRLPLDPARRARRRGRLPGHLPRPRPPGRRRPAAGLGRELAPRRRPAGRGPCPGRDGPSPPARAARRRAGGHGGSVRRGTESRPNSRRSSTRSSAGCRSAIARRSCSATSRATPARRRAPARLAGRDGQEPPGPRPGTPARTADSPRTGTGRASADRGLRSSTARRHARRRSWRRHTRSRRCSSSPPGVPSPAPSRRRRLSWTLHDL